MLSVFYFLNSENSNIFKRLQHKIVRVITLGSTQKSVHKSKWNHKISDAKGKYKINLYFQTRCCSLKSILCRAIIHGWLHSLVHSSCDNPWMITFPCTLYVHQKQNMNHLVYKKKLLFSLRYQMLYTRKLTLHQLCFMWLLLC